MKSVRMSPSLAIRMDSMYVLCDVTVRKSIWSYAGKKEIEWAPF